MEEFKAILEFLGAISWPVAVLIIAIMVRPEMLAILTVFRTRLQNPDQSISISTQGITIESIQAIQAKLEIQRASNQQVNELVHHQIIGNAASENSIPDALNDLADQYLKLSIPDWRQRVARRNEIAQRMAELALEHRVSRDLLAASGNEALILTMARLAVSFPEPADVNRLLSAAPGVSRLHVRYSIILAFGRLVEDRLVGPETVSNIREILARFEVGADESLRERIMQLQALITITT
jgi:hypothetical protein